MAKRIVKSKSKKFLGVKKMHIENGIMYNVQSFEEKKGKFLLIASNISIVGMFLGFIIYFLYLIPGIIIMVLSFGFDLGLFALDLFITNIMEEKPNQTRNKTRNKTK